MELVVAGESHESAHSHTQTEEDLTRGICQTCRQIITISNDQALYGLLLAVLTTLHA